MGRSVAVQFERAAPDAPESTDLMQEFWREIDHLYGNVAPTQSLSTFGHGSSRMPKP